jgi:hypothetical protein
VVLAEAEDTWTEVFRRMNRTTRIRSWCAGQDPNFRLASNKAP